MQLNTWSRRGVLLCGVVLLSLAPALAHLPRASKPEGVYTLDETASDNVDAAIKVAVKETPFYARGRVASELKKNTRPYRRVEIHYARTEVSISTDQWEALKTSADGTAVHWTRGDGEKFEVVTVWEGEDLKQTFTGEKGQRVNTYSLGADGKTLTVQVRVTAKNRWLKQALTYKLLYKSSPDATPHATPPPVGGRKPPRQNKPRHRKG